MSDERIERVEERMAWLERHVVEQDKAMLEMSETIRRLRAELVRLQERTQSSSETAPLPLEERPPHY